MAEAARKISPDEEPGHQESSPRPELKGLPGGGQSSEPTGKLHSVPTPEELDEKEQAPDDESDPDEETDSDDEADDTAKDKPDLKVLEGGGGDRRGSWQTRVGQKHKGPIEGRIKDKRQKALLAGIAAVVLLFIGGGIIIHILSSSLLLLNVHSHISERRMVRSVRTLTKNVNTLTTEKIATSVAGDDAKSLLSKSTLGKAVNTYNPKRALANMKAQGALNLEYEKGRISAVVIDGRRIDTPQLKRFRIFHNRAEWKRFYQQLYFHTDQALLRDGQGFIVRSRVSKEVVKAFGGHLWWWQRLGLEARGKAPAQIAQDEQLRLWDEIDEKSEGTKTTPDELREARDKGTGQMRKCLLIFKCAEKVRSGQLSLLEESGASKTIASYGERLVNASKSLTGVLSAISGLISVAIPVCIIYDGSMNAAKAIIGAQSIASMRAWFSLSSAVSQQNNGDVTGEAIEGLNRLYGNISNTIPEKMARNEAVDTTTEPFAHAARFQNYSIFDVIFINIFGKSLGKRVAAAAAGLLWMCPYLLNPAFILTTLLLELGITVLAPGFKFAVSTLRHLAAQGAKKEVGRVLKKVVTNITAKLSLKNDPVKKRLVRNGALKFGFFTGGVVALEQGARLMVMAEMGSMVDGSDVNDGTNEDQVIAEAPAPIVNQADMGAVQHNNELDRVENYGRPMTAAETAGTQQTDKLFVQNDKARQSVFQRYFALSNPDSVVARGIMNANDGIEKPSKLASAFLHIPRYIGNLFNSMFKPFPAYAAAQDGDGEVDLTNYNIIQWGWTNKELELIDNDPSFEPLRNAGIVAPHTKEITKKYGDCYSKSIEELQSTINHTEPKYLGRDVDTGAVTQQGLCSPKSLSVDNSEFGPKMVFRWRYDCSLRSAMIEMQNTENADSGSSSKAIEPCTAPGVSVSNRVAPSALPTSGSTASTTNPGTNPSTTPAGPGVTGDIGLSSDTVACATGTKDLGVVSTLYTGGYKKESGPLVIRLCQIPDIPGVGNNTSGTEVGGGAVVNSRVSGAWKALGEAAKADGVKISAYSSFRLAHSCRGGGDGGACARRGESPHQMGVAIDFSETHVKGTDTTTCSARAEDPGNAAWEWLLKNAERFGIEQYTYESWHWDPLPAANRCNSSERHT